MRPLLLEAGCQVRSRVHPLTITTSRCVRCDLSPFPRARKVTVKAGPIFVRRAFEGWVICGVPESVNIRVGSPRFAFALFYVAVLHAFGERRGEAALSRAPGSVRSSRSTCSQPSRDRLGVIPWRR